jgi:uncharacterized protein (TIGR03118 family)
MKLRLCVLLFPVAACLLAAPLRSSAQFNQVNLVSDQPGVALTTDPSLVNPWGIASGPGGPFWISDNATGLATLYNGSGVKQGLVVTVPPPAGGTPPSAPTGQVFNASSDFGNARFLFSTENGTLAGWTAGTTAITRVDNSSAGAVYKGLALANNGSVNRLYAANFSAGRIDVFDSSFQTVALGGSAFTDPSLPAGYAPFNVQTVGNRLFVTYALQDAAKHDDVAGTGNGVVDVYSPNGVLLQRFASGSAAGGTLTQLNSPWGLAIAPARFGAFSNDLLIGNFGDGHINAFDPTTGDFRGQMTDANGNVITIDGLWGLAAGTGGNNGLTDHVYFTAGPGNESHGLFGSLAATPEPSAWVTGLIGFGSLLTFTRRRRRK